MGKPQLLWDVKAELGEGPVWRASDRTVWFVDIKGRRLHCYGVADGATKSWDAPDQIGFALPAEDGSLVCGLRGGLYRFEAERRTFELVKPVEADRPHNRLNDGFVAPDGALWFGSMDDRESEPSGALYRYAGGILERHDDGYVVTNGPALCPQSRTLYHNDTLTGCIYAFDHENGRLTNKRLFAEVSDGFCDGPSVDADGVLHVGLFNGWGVARFDPSGQRLETIRFPVMTVTKAAFGGDDLKTLFCTTAWFNNADKRVEQPTLGGLYSVRVVRPGLPQALFRW